jgi:YrbI family 3-deoxy-D-manno-octulosonate 8-phosphate phosphatase
MKPRISPQALEAKFSQVELLVLDFDGVMTDNRVLVMEDGREAVWCSRSDGLGLELLRKQSIPVIVLSKEPNAVVARRCEKLKIPFVQGLDRKIEGLQTVLKERAIAAERVAFVGNDVNDLECLEAVGLPIAVSDAYPEVKAVAAYVTTHLGGRGAVREVCDRILSARPTKGKVRA